jgi:drug/metabolite transporter (DMT)-like permease
LMFSALNTVVAYGAFSESLAHWEASKISSILALCPLMTIAFVYVASSIWPTVVQAETLTGIAIVGAAMVVSGSITMSCVRAK